MLQREEKRFPLVVIGAGAGGLVIAIGAARAGQKVLLIEKGNYGGDCTNFGCIPSKSLIASAKIAYATKQGQALGLEGKTSFSAVKALERTRRIVEQVRRGEEPAALQEKGVETITGVAHFVDAHRLEVVDEQGNSEHIWGKHIVLATGSSPFIPPIPGLEGTPYLTNETIFALEKVPESLCILGGGPIGCEMAQAFSRLGSQVSIVHRREYLLKKEEVKAQRVIAEKFIQEGIHLYLKSYPDKIAYNEGKFTLFLKEGKPLCAEALLVATGREANVAALNLQAAGISFTEKGIEVDRYGRTTTSHIFAVGDVVGGDQFTHAAEHQARAVLLSIILPIKKKIDFKSFMPRVTYTDPEVASFGYLQKQAEEKWGKENIAVYQVPLTEVDRAITDGRTEGFVQVVTQKMRGQILGATLVAPHAGEMLPQLCLAARYKIPLRNIASTIYPYPTYSLAVRRVADLWFTQTLIPVLKNPFKRIPWKRILPLLTLVCLMLVAYFSGLHHYLSFEMLQQKHLQIKELVHDFPILMPVLFMLCYVVVISLSIPGGAFLSVAGGYLFSIPLSTVYVLIGATIGAAVIFGAAKTAFSALFRRKAGSLLYKMEEGFRKNGWSYLLFLRFVPLFPFWLVNIAPAFFKVSFFTYLWTTFVGIIPGAYVYTQAGEGLGKILESGKEFSLDNVLNIQLRIAFIALGIFALLPLIIKKIFKFHKHKKKFK